MGFRRVGALAALGLLIGATASAKERNDIRQFRVGMAASELPASGYTGFACAADPARTLAGWSEWRKCPPDADGRREVAFRYDDSHSQLARVNEGYRGTRVAGHPVLISLLIGDSGVVEAIRIDTDPRARMYMRKKAFLLGDQVKQHYGEDGWSCQRGAPAPDEQPIGGVFIKLHCEKTTDERHLVLDEELYRDPNKDLKDFVGGTQLLIEKSGRT